MIMVIYIPVCIEMKSEIEYHDENFNWFNLKSSYIRKKLIRKIIGKVIKCDVLCNDYVIKIDNWRIYIPIEDVITINTSQRNRKIEQYSKTLTVEKINLVRKKKGLIEC